MIETIKTFDNGIVHVCETTIDEENGEKSIHRYNVLPGQDYSSRSEPVRLACEATHTPDVVTAFLMTVPPAITVS